MSQASTPSRPTAVAIIASLMVGLGLPITVGLHAVALGGVGALVLGYQEGGWMMPVVLLAGGAVSVVLGGLLFFGVHRGSWALFGVAPLASVPALLGAAGFVMAHRRMAEALTSVEAADRATLFAAGFAESLHPMVLGLSATAGLLFAATLACLLGVAAQSGAARRVLLAGAMAFPATGVLFSAALLRPGRLIDGFRALSEIPIDQRFDALVALSAELEAARAPMLGGLVLLFIALLAGVAVLRREGVAAALFVLFTAGGLVGAGGQMVGRRLVEDEAAHLSASQPVLGLLELDGAPAWRPQWCVSGDVIDDCDGHVASTEALREDLEKTRELSRLLSDSDEVRVHVGLKRDATAAGLARFVEEALAVGAARVELVGETDRPGPELAPELGVLSTILVSRERSVGVWLEPRERACAGGCTFATIAPEGLTVGSSTWVPGPPEALQQSPREVVRLDGDTPLEPVALVRAALAAAAHDGRLTLVLGPPEAPVEEITQPLLRKVFADHDDAIRGCYESALRGGNPRLKGRIEVTFTVTGAGAVTGVNVAKDTLGSPQVTRCVVEEVRTLRFPPGDRADVEVLFPLVFTPAG